MPTWYQIATGPIARFSVIFCVLALLRLLALNLAALAGAVRRAGNSRLPWRALVADTFSWLLPVTRLHRSRPLYSYASFGFHLGLLPSMLLLRNHVDLIQGHFGVAWATLAKPWVDALAALTILCGLLLLAQRIYNQHASQLSSPADLALLALLVGLAASGFLAGQPLNPTGYEALMLAHTLMGMGLLLAAPFTKIAHCALYPVLRFGSEIAWRMRAGDGQAVVTRLYGPEGRQL